MRDPHACDADHVPPEVVSLVMADTRNAFEFFKKSHPSLVEVSQEDRDLLKQLCDEGRELGSIANSARRRVSQIKEELHAFNTMSDDSANAHEITQAHLLQEVVDRKNVYSASMDKLKAVKADIERIQQRMASKKANTKIQFDSWLDMVKRCHDRSASVSKGTGP